MLRNRAMPRAAEDHPPPSPCTLHVLGVQLVAHDLLALHSDGLLHSFSSPRPLPAISTPTSKGPLTPWPATWPCTRERSDPPLTKAGELSLASEQNRML